MIKLVREATGLGLKESKDLVEAAPSTIGGLGDAAAAELVAALEKAGARAGSAAARPWEAQDGGGADTAENLQLLCAPCSRAKGDSIG